MIYLKKLISTVQDNIASKTNVNKVMLVCTQAIQPVRKLWMIGMLFVSGCATVNSIQPTYVSPNTYQSYDCESLLEEYKRIHHYIKQQQKQQKNTDIVATGVGVGISAGRWGVSPNISIGLGKSTNKKALYTELSKLYGEQDAVVQSARMQQCPFAKGLKVYGE